LVGAAVGTFFNGAEFIVDKEQLTDFGMPVISRWMNPLHGLEAAFVIWNLCLGLAVFFLSRILALLYYINNVRDNDVNAKSHKQLIIETALFLVFFLTFVVHLLIADGFAVNADGSIVMEPYKYLHNFLDMPVVLAVFLAGVLLVLFGIIKTLISKPFTKGIWFAGTGTVLTVLALLLVAGWNHTAYYPSITNLQSSLTIENSSSSYFTLKTMMYVSFLIPFVLAYIFFAWRALDIHGINSKEVEEDSEAY
jgi:cytochrome d ubiquinol oxidase subunit II